MCRCVGMSRRLGEVCSVWVCRCGWDTGRGTCSSYGFSSPLLFLSSTCFSSFPFFISAFSPPHSCPLPPFFLPPSFPPSFSFPLDSLNSRCEDLSTYNQTLVEEKSQLTKMLSDAEQKISGSESWTRVQQLEQELREHQKLSQEQVGGVLTFEL